MGLNREQKDQLTKVCLISCDGHTFDDYAKFAALSKTEAAQSERPAKTFVVGQDCADLCTLSLSLRISFRWHGQPLQAALLCLRFTRASDISFHGCRLP